jgi:two-component system cell cycle response regulator
MDLRRTVVLPLRLAAFAGLVAYTSHTLAPDHGGLADFFDTRVYYALMLCAFVLCALRALAVPGDRMAWGCIAVGVGLYAFGDIYWQVAISHLDEQPFPSLADAGYLAYFPFVYAGLILLLRKRIRATRAVWLDGATAALAVGAVAAAVLVQVVLDSTGGSLAAVATNLAYPAGDILLLALLVGAAAVGGVQIGRSILLLTGALAVAAVADSIYLFQAAKGTYVEGTLLDALWPASMLSIAYAAWSDLSPPTRSRGQARALLLIPMVCGIAAVAVLLANAWFAISALGVVLAAAALGAVLVRLALTFRENQQLLELTHGEAISDPLTGLPNRRKLVDDLADACASLARGRTWVLALFDLDGFKFYNDTFGHPAGDALLLRLGTKLSAAVGTAGTVYRLGGDEFCLLTDAGVDDTAKLLDGAVDALTEHGEGFSVSTSFGAVFLPDDADNPSDALRLADQRLYAQKHQRQARRDRAHEVLLQALYEREPSIEEHVKGVVELSLSLARRLGMPPEDQERVERSALLHDVGKLAIPDEILRKPGRLTEEEFDFVRQHTIVGERILAAAPALRGLGAIVRATHERWDGAGYPDQLAGEAIPLAARVIAACDAYTAMRENRPYARAKTAEETIAELRRCSGSQFDPRVVEALIEIVATEERSDGVAREG